MSGESAQDIEVSITAPNRSFHATVIASDVAWQDRFAPDPAAAAAAAEAELPRRPIWSSAFGNSIDTDSEGIDPMVNSGTSLSQDSYDGFAVEFILSSNDFGYMNGDVLGGGAPSGAISATPAAAAASFTAPAAATTDATTASFEMRPVGFAETDRGSISCEMITPTPVLVGNGHVSSGEATVSSSSASTTVSGTTVTSSLTQQTTTVSSSGATGTTVYDGTVTGGATVTNGGDSEMTTHVPMAPGSTFQMSLVESHEEHAEAPERPRDRAMSMHERSMLAHDLHALSSTMDTIKDEEEENHVGSSSKTEEQRPEEPYTPDRRQSLTGVPVSATTFIANSQSTIFEAADESSAAPAADAAEQQQPAAAAAAAPEPASPVDEPSPYLRKLLDAQEATRQLMALLGESTQMLGTLPSAKKEAADKKEEQQATAAADVSSAAAAALAAIDSAVSFTSQSSMTSSSTFSSSTTGAATAIDAAAAPAATEVPSTPTAAAATATPATPTTPSAAAVPQSPALEISSRPIDITFDDGTTVQPAAAAAQPQQQEPAADAAPAAPVASDDTQNATICNALETLAANMTTVTTQNAPSPTLTTSTSPFTLDTTVQLQPTASPTVSLSQPDFPTADAPSTPAATDAAAVLHESTVASLAVDLPTPCPTPEPEQERFVTNNEQSEATITKSSFSFEASTTSSSSTTDAAAAASSTTDYVAPTTSVVLQTDDTPAAAPTVTPAAVDVPVEIVRHLDDAAAWHSAPIDGADSVGATAVPIAIVATVARQESAASQEPAASAAGEIPVTVWKPELEQAEAPSGPPPLAREPPLAAAPQEEAPAPPSGPPPLARERDEEHHLERSVMVERRVLSPDSSLHAALPTAQQEATTDASVQQQQPAAPTAAADEAPLTVVLQPSQQQLETPKEAPIEIPVSVVSSADDWVAAAPAAQAAPESSTSQEPAAAVDIPVTVVASAADWVAAAPQETAASQEHGASAVDIPVTVVEQQSSDKSEVAADAPAASQEPAATAAVDFPVTVVKTAADWVAAAPQESAARKTPAEGEIPVTVWKPELEQAAATTDATPAAAAAESASAPSVDESSEQAVNMPTLACELTSAPVAQDSEQPQQATEPAAATTTEVQQLGQEPTYAAAAAATEKPQSQEPAADAAATEPATSADGAPEVPVANASQQEQQAADAAPPAADAAAGAPTTSPTTAHAPVSLDSTFQMTPSDDDVAHPPTMPRDRAMSIHEKSLLAHEPSGFQPGLEPLPENGDNGGDAEVHVGSAIATEAMRRRASLTPGTPGTAASSSFQLPSTSCLFTAEDAAPLGAVPEESASETPPNSTASPSGEESPSTTVASSLAASDAVIDVTAPQAAEAAKPPQPSSGGVQWLTESEPCSTDEHSRTPESVVAAAPATQQQPEPAAPATTAPEPASESATDAAAAPVPATQQQPEVATPAADNVSFEPAAAVAPATPTTTEAPPQTPKSPADVSWVTVPAAITIDQSAQPVPENQAPPPQTPKTPTGVSWITEPTESVQQDAAAAQPLSEAAPQTPKTPSAEGVTWISEPAAPSADATQAATSQQEQPPSTPKTPTGVSFITEPVTTTTPGVPESQAPPPQTPKTPTGVAWITEPAAPAAAAAAVQQSEAPPQTPKTPTGVSWITEPATVAGTATSGAPDGARVGAVPAPLSPSVIDITAAPGDLAKNGAAAGAAPLTPTSPGIKWASDTTRTGGNADGAGAPPAPKESTFVVNAPWEGADAALPAAAAAPDADGVTWITEPADGAPAKEAEAPAPRPPLTRSESTRSERDASSVSDITVRAATPQRKTIAPSVSVDEESLTNGVTQESLGTKVRKLSWADQQQSGAEDSFSAAIDDYEKKLNETTAQTRELVDLLCQTGSQITENSMKMSDVFSDAVQAGVRSMLDQERRDRAAAVLSPIAENGEHISREAPPQLVAGALPPNVESVIVSCEALKYVTGSLVLENANILVTDEESGLFLFTLDSKVVRHVTNPAWKRASSPCIFKDRLKSYILILMDVKDDEGAWVRHIVKFTENLDYMEKVECPIWIKEKTILSDRLAVNRYENIYYCANGEIFSGLYELAPTGKWTELLYRQSESFVDMLAFAIIGPIQQILIVEGRRDHVLLCSIRESQCVEARRMAICERPGALAKDESGRLFVMNRAQAAVQIVDTRVWAACRNMALVDKFVPHFSASFGMLVIPQKRAVKVHKYSFEWDD